MIHELKTWPEYFEMIFNGEKAFEVRKDDRNYQVGDVLSLREWEPKGYNSVAPNEITGAYTGREINKIVTYILRGGQFGINDGYCIMSIK